MSARASECRNPFDSAKETISLSEVVQLLLAEIFEGVSHT